MSSEAKVMTKDRLLVVLNGTGALLCWLPAMVEPNRAIPLWLPLTLVASGTAVLTILRSRDWLLFVGASVLGTFVGLVVGFEIWPPTDPVAAPYLKLFVLVATLITLLSSLFIGLASRKVFVSNQTLRRVLWIILGGYVSFGPIALALTPRLVTRRLARNDRLAASRIQSLTNAVRQTVAEAGDPERVCNWEDLRRHYSGPTFSQEEWQHITSRYVERDGYSYRVYCQEVGGFAIEALRARNEANGTRHLCADEAHSIGCDLGSNGVRQVCKPCAR
jgi:hypothetical protein